MGAGRKIVKNAVFLGKWNDNEILKVQNALSGISLSLRKPLLCRRKRREDRDTQYDEVCQLMRCRHGTDLLSLDPLFPDYALVSAKDLCSWQSWMCWREGGNQRQCLVPCNQTVLGCTKGVTA